MPTTPWSGWPLTSFSTPPKRISLGTRMFAAGADGCWATTVGLLTKNATMHTTATPILFTTHLAGFSSDLGSIYVQDCERGCAASSGGTGWTGEVSRRTPKMITDSAPVPGHCQRANVQHVQMFDLVIPHTCATHVCMDGKGAANSQ